MAEVSIFWPAPTFGDGASNYTDTQLTQWIRHMTGGGVHQGFGNELAVSGVASPLTIGYGAAVVNGYPYYLTADMTLAVPTPTGGTTGHSVVLRADWATQTVRVKLRSSPDGNPAFPAVVVSEGTTSETLLAHVAMTTCGVITVTDARDYLYFHTKVARAMIDNNAIDGSKLNALSVTGAHIVDETISAAKIQNRIRRFLVPPSFAWNSTAAAPIVATSGSNYGG
jgi:hypothetical protein